MAILAFQKPERVIVVNDSETKGRFEFRPLEPGYAQTVGNSIRRILLSSLEGYAVTSIRIEGVDHEFTTIPGVIEGMQDIILNFKQLRLKKMSEDSADSETVNLVIKGANEFTANDISKKLSGFSILNPSLHICTLEPSVKLEITLTIGRGRGFVPAEEQNLGEMPLGTIAIDSIFTPIVNVNWLQEDWRVEQKTDYEKLILDIETDGSISPKAALSEAAQILIYHFQLLADESKLSFGAQHEGDTPELDEESLRIRHLLMTKLSDMNLSVRAYNCLKTAEIETFADLVSYSRAELMKFRNFGRKSLTEIDTLVERMKLQFGMDVSKYNIETRKHVD